jgi:hypothetical protein
MLSRDSSSPSVPDYIIDLWIGQRGREISLFPFLSRFLFLAPQMEFVSSALPLQVFSCMVCVISFLSFLAFYF